MCIEVKLGCQVTKYLLIYYTLILNPNRGMGIWFNNKNITQKAKRKDTNII